MDNNDNVNDNIDVYAKQITRQVLAEGSFDVQCAIVAGALRHIQLQTQDATFQRIEKAMLRDGQQSGDDPRRQHQSDPRRQRPR